MTPLTVIPPRHPEAIRDAVMVMEDKVEMTGRTAIALQAGEQIEADLTIILVIAGTGFH